MIIINKPEDLINDFTKDELGFILNAIKHYDEDNCFGLFINQIQSMIETYCEHEEKSSINHCVDCGVSEYRCNNCGHVLYEGL